MTRFVMRRLSMRKLFALGSLSTLVASAFLVLLAAAGLSDSSCSMQQGRAAATGVIVCVPGPTFDCCKGNSVPTSPGSAQLSFNPLTAAVAVTLQAGIEPGDYWAADAGRLFEPLGPASHIPLYTLLATLLI
jgi:hypothetical protein